MQILSVKIVLGMFDGMTLDGSMEFVRVHFGVLEDKVTF